MADHVRTQIRDAAAAVLTGLTTTGARVHAARLPPMREPDMPCLLLATESERIEALTVHGPATLDRTLTLTVRGMAMADAVLDRTLDTIAAEVEAALGDTTLGNLAKSVVLQGIEIDMDDALQQPAGVITLNYSINYMTTATAPTTAI